MRRRRCKFRAQSRKRIIFFLKPRTILTIPAGSYEEKLTILAAIMRNATGIIRVLRILARRINSWSPIPAIITKGSEACNQNRSNWRGVIVRRFLFVQFKHKEIVCVLRYGMQAFTD